MTEPWLAVVAAMATLVAGLGLPLAPTIHRYFKERKEQR